MAPIAQRARGTQDLLPRDQPVWDAMQAAAVQQAERFGYQRIETPIFEPTELFVRAAGEASDIVAHEMYTFTDRGNRSLTLRPEGTAPVLRAYFDGGLDQEPQPVRLYYMGPYFRYDRPQAGRMRELHQFGIEAIGENSPLLDVEAILLAWAWFGALSIDGITLRINSIGDEVCRPAYRDRLRDYYRQHLDQLSAESRVRLEKNPLRLFDSKDPQEEALKRDAPKIVDHLCPPCAEAFARVQATLASEKVPFTLDPQLVRGLDYYTRTVFEFQHESLGGAQNALCGGGRYDGLATALGYRSTPGIGFAAGLDRTAIVLKDKAPQVPPGPDVYAVALESDDEAYVLHLAGMLRAQGLRVVVDPGGGRLDAKLRKAARRGARVTVLVGPTEREKDEVVVRDMRQKTQVSVPVNELMATVTRALTTA
ncbi:MAG TPA: histidine--tRNA ligase [Candidatus Dormibacteraeota bacterium]|jgi:histidyl-tRNA synthetase|nr:histidine--tRNA ligase [Candidatus Dormibacteraeota bacterium]